MNVDELVDAHRQAERRLRHLLLGDGMYSAGLVKGDEGRTQVARELGRMRDALAALREIEEARAGEAEARVADLEETLKGAASSTARM